MRVVLDCNVLISAGLNPGICRTVLHEVLESHQCILSAQILQEYVTVAGVNASPGPRRPSFP
jgi:predicted nucleic acid-binding protein